MAAPEEPADPLAEAREFFAEWNRNVPDLRAWAEARWAEDIFWEEPPGFPDAGTHRGREACIRRMQERLRLLGGVQIEVLNAEKENDVMYVEAIVRGRGAASGVPTEMREYFVAHRRGDFTTRWREFLERGPARAAFAEEVARAQADAHAET